MISLGDAPAATSPTSREAPTSSRSTFSRIDYTVNQGVLVARVSMSPLFVMQLIDALQTAFQQYTDEAMPQEVSGDGGTNPSGGDPDSTPDAP